MSDNLKTFLGMPEYEWSTHQPLIKATMELYKPSFVLELGIGESSTSIFLEYKTKLLSVENNNEWIDYIKTKYENIDVIYHDLKDEKITLTTHLYDLNESKKNEITSFYEKLKFSKLRPNLLFVDQYTCARTLSINALGDKFDLIIYHDSQPAGIPWYSYNLIKLDNFNNYHIKTNTSWATLMVRKNMDKGLESLSNIITPHIEDYKKDNPTCPVMIIDNNY